MHVAACHVAAQELVRRSAVLQELYLAVHHPYSDDALLLDEGELGETGTAALDRG